ncbi:hypothetical protein Misp02_40130 [Microtetraspora sp. NBRC 16547]|nr:hypothetical protein Misp02_40130 [Microtetraspora sp. NBRC 16547]
MLQRVENLTDRQAAETVRADLSWKYALGLALDDPGFDASVLSEFRTRVVAHGLEEKALDLLLAKLAGKGLIEAGDKQRTDSTHVISAVRDLNRLELAGECVRAALEAITATDPGRMRRERRRLCAGGSGVRAVLPCLAAGRSGRTSTSSALESRAACARPSRPPAFAGPAIGAWRRSTSNTSSPLWRSTWGQTKYERKGQSCR